MRTRFGPIAVSVKHPFSRPVLGQRTSPFLQEKLVELGTDEVFGSVQERVERLLGISVCNSQVYRSCQNVAEEIAEKQLSCPSSEMSEVQAQPEKMLYGMVDGSMLQLDGGWQETKVGRVFEATQNTDSQTLDWTTGVSTYVAKRGPYEGFTGLFEEVLPPDSPCKKVFITDAAQWICHWIALVYPSATHILDYFHVCEKLGGLAPKDAGVWLDKQKTFLLESKTDAVIRALKKLRQQGVAGVDQVIAYFEAHKGKMNYKYYREQGWMIGSGPIESAHRTVLQVRLTRSGQRWAEAGCDNVIKLRVLYKNMRSHLVRNALKTAA